jgi:predicted dehydrogenase
VSPIRLGLIGAGSVGVQHAEAAAQTPAVRVTAICDKDPQVARRLAARCDAQAFVDHRALLAAGIVDAVVVNTPHALHTDIVCEAAESGRHVLVEKPMATRVADCERMIEACARAGVRLVVGHVQHFLPDKVAARRAIDSGEIGQPLLATDSRSSDYRTGGRPAWFFDPQIAGGGVLMNIGAHSVDRTLWLMGGEPREVSASLVVPPDLAVETDALVRLDLADGRTVHIEVTSTGAPPAHERLQIVGERGSLVASMHGGTVLHVDGRTRVLHEPAEGDIPKAFAAQLAAFASCVNAGTAPAVDGSHGLRVVAVVLAAYAAAKAGEPVAVGPVSPDARPSTLSAESAARSA